MAEEAVLICKICGHHNPANVKLCVKCSSVLQLETSKIDPPPELDPSLKHGTRHFGKILILHIHGGNEFLEVELEEGAEIVIGRYDPTNGESPDVDLSNHGGADKGVSRKHATLTYKNGSLRITDNNSANYTYMNNQRLYPNQSRMLRDKDELRFGRLVVTVQFGERSSST